MRPRQENKACPWNGCTDLNKGKRRQNEAQARKQSLPTEWLHWPKGKRRQSKAQARKQSLPMEWLHWPKGKRRQSKAQARKQSLPMEWLHWPQGKRRQSKAQARKQSLPIEWLHWPEGKIPTRLKGMLILMRQYKIGTFFQATQRQLIYQNNYEYERNAII